MESPANYVIKKCGCAAKVAALLGRDKSSVHRWIYSKVRSGTGGLVPSDKQDQLICVARESGIELLPEDFFRADALDPVEVQS